jgi:FkbM family methyltransferase
MALYGQTPDVQLLAALLAEASSSVVIDVGAERGDFAAALRDAGAEHVYAIEPEPDNVVALQRRFHGDPRVEVIALAVSSSNGSVDMHRSVAPDGSPISYGHTILARPDTDEIAWRETFSIDSRTLGTLANEERIPQRVGILKIDTEGHDLEVLKGMGGLDPDFVMVEHWRDLPLSLGACPWSTQDLKEILGPRGFHHFGFIVHRGEFVLSQYDDDTIPTGSMGNILFLHDRVLESSLPHLLTTATRLAIAAVAIGEARAAAADERLDVIRELEEERSLQAAAAAERLTALEDIARSESNAP